MKKDKTLINGLAKRINKKDEVLKTIDTVEDRIEVDEDFKPEKVDGGNTYKRKYVADPFNHLTPKKYNNYSIADDPFSHLHPKDYKPYRAIDNKEQKKIFGLPADSKLKPMDNDLYYEHNLKGKTVKDIVDKNMLEPETTNDPAMKSVLDIINRPYGKETPDEIEANPTLKKLLEQDNVLYNEVMNDAEKSQKIRKNYRGKKEPSQVSVPRPEEIKAKRNVKMKNVMDVVKDAEYTQIIKDNQFGDLVNDAKKVVNKPISKKQSALYAPLYAGNSIPVQSVISTPSDTPPPTPPQSPMKQSKKRQTATVFSPIPAMQNLNSDSSEDSGEETGETKTEKEILAERKRASLAKTTATAESQVPVIIEELHYLSSGFTDAEGVKFTEIYLTKSDRLAKASYKSLMEMSIPEEIKEKISNGMTIADFRKVFKKQFFSQKSLAI